MKYKDGRDGKIVVRLGGVYVQCLIDSGSPVNVMSEGAWESLQEAGAEMFATEDKCLKKLFGYGSESPLKISKTFRARVEINEEKPKVVAQFYVVTKADQILLGKTTSEELRVLKVGLNVNTIQEIKEGGRPPVTAGSKPFPKVPKMQFHFEVDQQIMPKKSMYFRVPVAVEDLVDKKLDEMLEQDIIEEVHEPTDWVSPLIVVPKGNSDIRLCVNMKKPNEAIKRIHHPLPVIGDFLPELDGAQMFSRLDIKSAFHHLELTVESRRLTTFYTRRGLMRYKRLVFGVNCAPEMFQKFMEEVKRGIDGTMVMIDDIIVYGKTKNEHDRRLEAVKQRLIKNNLTINEEKSLYCVEELDFLGHHLSRTGIRPTEEKVQALRDFRQPETCEEVASFIGLVTYVGSFIHRVADRMVELRKATKEPFVWKDAQQKEFDDMRQVLIKETLERAYFQRHAETFLYTDASGTGLGAVLLQRQYLRHGRCEPRVVAYASKSLTDVERRYAQTHREALAVVWAVKHFYMYLFGLDFVVMTDHLPLKTIFGPRPKDMSKRMITRAEAWALQLQPFRFKVEFVPGNLNIADILSRLRNKKDEPFEEESQCFLAAVTNDETNANKVVSLEDIREASCTDVETQAVIKALQDDRWPDELKMYQAIKEELGVECGILARESKAVVPKKLREQILRAAHMGHPGVTTMKLLIRDRVWWPSMNKSIDEFAKSCMSCALVRRDLPPEELSLTKLPDKPWDVVAIDFLDAPEGKILVIVDYNTRYVHVETMKNTDAESLIKALEKPFGTWGRPALIRSDNGPPFNSDAMKTWCESYNIAHDRTTPYTPQQNGEVETQNRGINKAIKIARSEGKNWKVGLREYVFAYNRRLNRSTQKAPLSLMTNRQIRDNLPLKMTDDDVLDESWKERDVLQKLKTKHYVDARRHARPSGIEVGDMVLVKNRAAGKHQTNFLPFQHEVLNRQGKEFLVKRIDTGTTSRHVSTQLQKWPEPRQTENRSENENQNDDETQSKEIDDHSKPTDGKPKEINVDTESYEKVDRRSTRLRKPNAKFATQADWDEYNKQQSVHEERQQLKVACIQEMFEDLTGKMFADV